MPKSLFGEAVGFMRRQWVELTRFRAQYLRRIRVPAMGAISRGLAKSLTSAFRARDFAAIDRLALKAYGLDALPSFDFVETRQ